VLRGEGESQCAPGGSHCRLPVTLSGAEAVWCEAVSGAETAAVRVWPVGIRSPPGTKNRSPPVMGSFFTRGGKGSPAGRDTFARGGIARNRGEDSLTSARLIWRPHESSSRPRGLGEDGTVSYEEERALDRREGALTRCALPADWARVKLVGRDCFANRRDKFAGSHLVPS